VSADGPSPRLLAIDTTEAACSAALLLDGVVSERFEIAPRRHSELALPMMDALLRDAGLGPADLDAIAFARGPGSFTGVRIATAIAQGAAFGAGLPLVPVSSLQALAAGVAREAGEPAQVLVALDARMNEVYWGGYRGAPGEAPIAEVPDTVCAPASVPLPGPGTWYAAGSGWQAHGEMLVDRVTAAGLVVRESLPEACIRARDVARVAAALWAEGTRVDAEHALPVYLRDEVAWARS
jgi:tRNA threonylcarbamoyladenosine biosynthesis protein TsaB